MKTTLPKLIKLSLPIMTQLTIPGEGMTGVHEGQINLAHDLGLS